MSAAYPPTFKYVQLEVKGNYVIITLNRSELVTRLSALCCSLQWRSD